MNTRRANAATPVSLSDESGEQPYAHDVMEELAPGTLVAGKYRVKDVLGRGGFAVVYDAEHLGLARDVALKLLHRTQGTPQVLIERFLREVRLSALVRHSHVLEVYDAGVHEDGSPFLAMEKINGGTLHQLLCFREKLEVAETIVLARQLLSALVALAARGIVHRDIKPENLMLARAPTGELQLKLVDFGIALTQEEPFAPRLTQQGTLVGTPHYMAPEQLRSGLADARVDIYAVGVVMYQALTGVLPYDGTDLSSLTLNVMNGRARALGSLRPDCPARLARVVQRALARDPERRYRDASAMLRALEACPTEERSGTHPAARFFRLGVLSRRPRELIAVAATVVLMALGTSHAAVAGALRSTFPRAFGERDTSGLAIPQATAAAALAPVRAAPELDTLPAAASSQPARPPDREPKLPAASQAGGAEPVLKGASARRSASLPPRDTGTAEREAQDAARARQLLRKGLALYLHAELDAAYAVYRQASLTAPTEPAAFRGLGLSASRLGRKLEARRAFARYLELAPDAPDARLIRARLAALLSEEAIRELPSTPPAS